MPDAAQKACERGETMAQNSSPRRISSCFPLGLCGGLSFFLDSFFPFLLDLFPRFFFIPFLTYCTTEQGWGDREAVARRMSSKDETRVRRKDGTKGRKHK
jgi:hypothetical protein